MESLNEIFNGTYVISKYAYALLILAVAVGLSSTLGAVTELLIKKKGVVFRR